MFARHWRAFPAINNICLHCPWLSWPMQAMRVVENGGGRAAVVEEARLEGATRERGEGSSRRGHVKKGAEGRGGQ